MLSMSDVPKNARILRDKQHGREKCNVSKFLILNYFFSYKVSLCNTTSGRRYLTSQRVESFSLAREAAKTITFANTSCFQTTTKVLREEMFSATYLIFGLFLTSFIGIRTELCSKTEIQRARESHHTCLSRMKDKLFQYLIVFQQSTHLIKSEDELCQIINETAFGCDQGYENCLNQNEIR